MPKDQDLPPGSKRRDFIPCDSVDSLILQRTPGFEDYLFFHNVLDKFCWMLKLHYAGRETVKRKQYRIDTLFQRFLVANRVGLDKIRKCQTQPHDKQKLEYHLTKGWHNELVRSDPLHLDYLHIGTVLNGWGGPGSGGLAAWNIVQSYYAVFEFTSCIATSISRDLDTRGHKKVAKHFNNHTIGAARERIVFYPFGLTSSTPLTDVPQHPGFSQYHYASYPREPGKSIADLDDEVTRAFAVLRGGSKASIVDLLYELRLWANYTGVQSLLKLADGGYQQFLMRNLATIIYFMGGLAELAVIAAVGETKFLGILKRFSLDYIDRHERFARNKYLIPSYIRLRSYKHLGILDGAIEFVIPESSDPVQFIDV